MADLELITRIDRLVEQVHLLQVELAALRGEVAALAPSAAVGNGTIDNTEGADDLSDGNLIDTHAAQERFGYPRDTIAKWCREGCGIKRGGRWLVDPVRLARRLNGSG
jgi:hypothetical protein